eukprot:29351-Pelagococcus_subviridis.AAC.2
MRDGRLRRRPSLFSRAVLALSHSLRVDAGAVNSVIDPTTHAAPIAALTASATRSRVGAKSSTSLSGGGGSGRGNITACTSRIARAVAFHARRRLPGKPSHAFAPSATRLRSRGSVPLTASAPPEMNACSNADAARLLKSSSDNPRDAATRAYSRDSDVEKIPGSSVHSAIGCLARRSFLRWCRDATRATSTQPFPPPLLPASLPPTIESVITLLVTHTSTHANVRFRPANSAGSRTVFTQCPKRSGLNRSIDASSPGVTTSPQCSVTGNPNARASTIDPSNRAHVPSVGSPLRSIPTTPRSASRSRAASFTVRVASAAVSRRSTLRAIPYKRSSGWSSKASGGVERRRGRGL